VVNSPKLSHRARAVVAAEDNDIYVSAVVAWELATKTRLGKWPDAAQFAINISSVIEENRFTPLAITLDHARTAGFLPGRHRDPFDRILAAQSQVEGMPLLSADRIFRIFGTAVMW
jgi:PIN domain nuclease of toxin-antitoxin system